MEPCLALTSLGDVDKATLFLKLLIHEHLVKAISKGEPQSQAIFELANHVLAMAEKASTKEDLSPLLTAATNDVGIIAKFFLFMESEVGDVAPADALRDSKEGAKSLVFQAVRQNSFWRQRDAEARKHQLAISTMGPDFQAKLAALESNTKDALKEAVSKLPVYLDNMPARALSQLFATITKHAELELGRSKGQMSSKLTSAAVDALASSMDEVSWQLKAAARVFENKTEVSLKWLELAASAEQQKKGMLVKTAKDIALGKIEGYLSEDLSDFMILREGDVGTWKVLLMLVLISSFIHML